MMRLQKYISKFLFKEKTPPLSNEDFNFKEKIKAIVGYEIRNIDLYKEAFSLKLSKNNYKNYERLEFLGDAVLGSIISSYLFINYPKANEGFMTQLKSKIVNRKNLNKLGEELKLSRLIKNTKGTILSEDIAGNLFEALIGAIFLDTDYESCKKIVLGKLLTPEKINQLENKIISYKSLLLEWSQKEKKSLAYETVEESSPSEKTSVFRSYVILEGKRITNASESSKKKAEEKAAQRAFYSLNKKQRILTKIPQKQ